MRRRDSVAGAYTAMSLTLTRLQALCSPTSALMTGPPRACLCKHEQHMYRLLKVPHWFVLCHISLWTIRTTDQPPHSSSFLLFLFLAPLSEH